MGKPDTQDIDKIQESLSLPAEIQIKGYLGKGARSHVFEAILDEDIVIVKTYRKEVAQKYRDKYDIDIAEFEFGRNKSLYDLNEIKKILHGPIECTRHLVNIRIA